jgi:NodT family efflux transporter outer membrane factor (OMF) lipoprotein
MMMRSAGLLLFVMAAGCTPVGPEFVRPEVATNPDWLEAELEAFETDPPELAEWWKRLNDPALDALVARAVSQNNNLKIAGLRVLEAQASLNVARGALYPQGQVAVGEATALAGSESNANTTAGDLEFTQFNIGASVSWEIDFWGRFRRGIEAADANLLASVAAYDEAMVLLVATVADVYTLIRSTEEQLRLARESAAIQRRSYEIVDLLFRRGDSSELDALQARTLLLSTLASIPGLETNLQQARNALSTLLGMTPSDIEQQLDSQPDGSEARLPSLTGEIRVGIPADLLRQRPDVRRAELRALTQNARVGIAEANLYPSFSLQGFLGLAASGNTDTTRTGQSGFDELFSVDSLTYSVGPAFVWPFLNYGRIRNDIRVQDARLQQALIAYRETVIQAAREVEDAMTAFSRSREQDRILAETVAVARRSAELSLLRYQEGFADYQRVLDAQQALFRAQQRYAANRGAVISNFIAIYRSLGGGWQSPEPRRFIDEKTRKVMMERTNWGDMFETPPSPAEQMP